MNNKVLAAIKRYNMITKGQDVTVALSGGADSVALLHCLLCFKDILGFSLSAAHLNHGIRGEEAFRDEQFCSSLCQKMNIPLIIGRVNVPLECEKTGESEELCARRLRYNFFEGLKTDLVATAHTASDNAETMLFNLSRGSGIKGLSGIPYRRDIYIRPMLDVTRAEVEDYCKANLLNFVTDSTNLSDDYTRNYIRSNVIPYLKEVNSAFEQNAARAAELLRADSDYLETETGKEYERLLAGGKLSIEAAKLHPSICSRVVARFLEQSLGEAADNHHVKSVVELLLKGSGVVQLKFGFEAQAARGWLWVFKRETTEDYSIPLEIGANFGKNYSFEVCPISEADISCTNKINKLLLNGAIDCDKIVGKLVVRNRREGDALRPFGRGITKSIKNIFAESDVPMEKRGAFPLIADDEGIVWIYGQKTAERVAPDEWSKNIVFIKDFKAY